MRLFSTGMFSLCLYDEGDGNSGKLWSIFTILGVALWVLINKGAPFEAPSN